MKKIIVKRENLPSIKNEKKFINAIQLNRILSSLRYNQIIYATIDKENSISVNIKLKNFLNHAALLCEGVKKFKELKSKLKELKSYQERLDEIEQIFKELKDESSFLRNVLCRIRNKIAFHFDKRITKKIFKEIVDESKKKNKDVIFA